MRDTNTIKGTLEEARGHPMAEEADILIDLVLAALDRIEAENTRLRMVVEAARPVVRRWREGKSSRDEIALLDVAISRLAGPSHPEGGQE